MSLWKENKDDLKKDTTASGIYLKTSGVYDCKITEALIAKMQSGAEALKISFKTDDQESFRADFFYKKKNGVENEWVVRKLNQLVYLLKQKMENLKPVEDDGKITVPALVSGGQVGVVVEVSQDGQYTNYDIKTFYDIKSGKTTAEILEKKNADTIERFKHIYAAAEPAEKKEPAKNEELSDEFPF